MPESKDDFIPDDFIPDEPKKFPLGGPLRLPLQPKEATLSDVMGRVPGEALESAKKLGGILLNTAPGADVWPMGTLEGALVGAATLKEGLPNLQRAGAKFQEIMGKAKDIPLKTEPLKEILQGSQELSATGSRAPLVMRRLTRALNPDLPPVAGQTVAGEIPYSMGQKFGTVAGRLSAGERAVTDAPMQAQVGKLAAALREANRAAASTAGATEGAIPVNYGDLYTNAVNEYRRAKKFEDAVEAAKDVVRSRSFKIGAGSALGGGLAYELSQKFLRGNR